MYKSLIVIVILTIFIANFYKFKLNPNKYININQNCEIYATPIVNNLNNSSSNNKCTNNNTSNITFVCQFSNLIKKTLDTQIQNNELLVNFKDYYVYDEENKLIDRAVLTTSNSNFNKFLICNHFPNKDCKTVFMYLVDSNQKSSVSPDTNQYKEDYTSNFKEAEPIYLNNSSLVYDIDIISKNIINKHYDPNSNVYEVDLGEELEESNDKQLDKQRDDVLLKLDLTNPYLTYELNGVKINDNLTSLNSLKLNNNKLDSSYILVSHNTLSNKSSFVIINIKYKTKNLNKISNSVLIRVTRISCNNSAKSLYTKNNSSSTTIDTSSGNGKDTVDSINRSTTGDNDNDGRLPLLVDGNHADTHVPSDCTDRSKTELLDTNHTDNNNINSVTNSEHDRHGKPRIYTEQQENADVGTNRLNKLDKNSNGDEIYEWILTENDEKYEKFISFDNCPLKIEVIRQNNSTYAANLPIYLNGYKLNTNHYKVLVNSSTSFNIRFNNKKYNLEVSNDPIYKILNTNFGENMGDIASTVTNESNANTATANDFGTPEINISGWVANFVTMVIRIFTFVNIFSNISKFYFESLNYITFLFFFYGYLSGNFDNNGANDSTNGNLLKRITEKIIGRMLIYIDNASDLVPVKMFLLLNLVYIVNMVAIMCYLLFVITSNFKPKLSRKLKKLETNILALFIYLLLLMVLVFLKFDGNNEDVYMMGGRFNSFCFSSITLFLTILIILIIYQLYPRRRMNHNLNNTLFRFLDDSNRGGIYPNSLPINSIYKSSNSSSPLSSFKTISGIKHTIGNSSKSKSTSPKSGYSNSTKVGSVVDFKGTLSTNKSDDPMLDLYQTVHSFPRQGDEPITNSKRDKVVINDKYRLLYINSLIIESTAIVLYYILTKREDGIYLVKFTFWLLVSLYIQRLNKYYDEKKINKYLLIKSLKYMVLAALIRIHVLIQNKLLETGSGVGEMIFGVSIGQVMAVIILIYVNQCINHKSLNRLYKSVIKIK